MKGRLKSDSWRRRRDPETGCRYQLRRRPLSEDWPTRWLKYPNTLLLMMISGVIGNT